MSHDSPYIENTFSYICMYGSVHRDSILIRPNKTQQYAGIYLLQIGSTVHVSGVHRTQHQDYFKL